MSPEKINLIPMAGAGQRFRDEGYTLPKPLIPVAGKPMILRACEALPRADRWIFVTRDDILRSSDLGTVLQNIYAQSNILSIDYMTEGQASTCALANDLIPDDSELLIGPCDNGMIWNRERYAGLLADQSVDAIIWTFRNYPYVRGKAHMYGWVKTTADRVNAVSCKKPISDDPLKDHAIVGTFYFRRAEYFKTAYKSLVRSNRRINNEFYVDELMNEVIEAGKKVKIFEIDKYLCWGTPDDLRTYEYWRIFFSEMY